MCFKVVLIKEKGHGLQSRIKKEMTGHGFRFVGLNHSSNLNHLKSASGKASQDSLNQVKTTLKVS